MPISAYPTPELGGPPTIKYTAEPLDFDAVTLSKTYEDGGISTGTLADAPVRRWTLEYDGLTALEADILDDHNEEAFGMVNPFTFTDREGVSYTAHYDKGGFTRSHNKQHIQKRTVKLISFPSA